jgi:hypothetical protein
MKIKKVKYLDRGFRGIEVEAFDSDKVGSRYYNNKDKKEYKHPIHLALETKTKDLRVFLLEMCGVLRGNEDKDEKDFIIAETDILSIELTKDGFVLAGERVMYGSKYVSYKTPKMSADDNYHHFDTVIKVIQEVMDEVVVHVAGTNKASDEEVLIRWVEKEKDSGIDVDTIKGMTPEQQKETLTKILEKMGACVMFDDEMIADTDISQELEEMSNVVEEVIVSDPEPVIEFKAKSVKEDLTDKGVVSAPEPTEFVIPLESKEPIIIKK